MTSRHPFPIAFLAASLTALAALGACSKPADPDIKSFDISMLTFKGVVQLSGFVDSQAQIDMATKLASAAEGASSVKNELMVKQ